ncbi:MAG: class I SAM-dependent methyltransferase [Tissierellia bacterium]|nr:class I SAM-dependent methyltransferase [Tissierellia bacterium]
MSKPGHIFLKELGRTKLRPGGGKVTKWLFSTVDFNHKNVLEIACNAGGNLIDLRSRYNVKLTGIDLDEEVIKEAKENLQALDYDDVDLKIMDATNLEFEDESFDIIINEAMLTMLSPKLRDKALKEYRRVLKKGGYLLTHDVSIPLGYEEKELSKTISHRVYPQTEAKWDELFKNHGFKTEFKLTGKFLLMDKKQVIEDEGPVAAAKFFKAAKENINTVQFKRMNMGLHDGDKKFIAYCLRRQDD